MCQVGLDDLGPCNAIISIGTMIRAIFDMPTRFRVINAFTTCTYVPFLIRWDLVPKWKRPSKKNI
jgi:hypothetical protein